jgi:hypothetical protein
MPCAGFAGFIASMLIHAMRLDEWAIWVVRVGLSGLENNATLATMRLSRTWGTRVVARLCECLVHAMRQRGGAFQR